MGEASAKVPLRAIVVSEVPAMKMPVAAKITAVNTDGKTRGGVGRRDPCEHGCRGQQCCQVSDGTHVEYLARLLMIIGGLRACHPSPSGDFPSLDKCKTPYREGG